jgi:pimeloyl-ACP methyl ester carboxylesterase
MPEAEVNGVTLYYEIQGDGEPLVLVHGAWVDATAWAFVVAGLARSFRVLTYDRRGHSRSERPPSEGSLEEDGDDLAVLLETLGLAPAHVVGSSSGGIVALLLALRRPHLFRSLACHEPPLWGLLENDAESAEVLRKSAGSLDAVNRLIADGDHEGAARRFVEEVALGPGAWDNVLPPQARAIFVKNAPTFLGEFHAPEALNAKEDALSRLEVTLRLTEGSESPPVFVRVIDRLMELVPGAVRQTIEGAAHLPQLQAPDQYVCRSCRHPISTWSSRPARRARTRHPELRLGVAGLDRRIAAGADVLRVGPRGVAEGGPQVGVPLEELGPRPRREAGHVGPDEHLRVGARARADADRGDDELLRDPLCQLGGHDLEHQ